MAHTSIDKEDYEETLEELIAANLKEHSLYVVSICVVVLSEVSSAYFLCPFTPLLQLLPLRLDLIHKVFF